MSTWSADALTTPATPTSNNMDYFEFFGLFAFSGYIGHYSTRECVHVVYVMRKNWEKQCKTNPRIPNACYIPLARIGNARISVGSARLRVGSPGVCVWCTVVHIGCPRAFGYQHVGNSNVKWFCIAVTYRLLSTLHESHCFETQSTLSLLSKSPNLKKKFGYASYVTHLFFQSNGNYILITYIHTHNFI